MFSRRDIQRSVNELARVLSVAQLELLVRRLNSRSLEQIGAEWEAIVLAAIGRVAQLKYEHNSGGTSRPDILASLDNPQLDFVADVCTASDADMEEVNPVEFLREQIVVAARKLGMTGAGLFLKVDRMEPKGKRQRSFLALPSKGEVPGFVRVNIQPFLEQVAATTSINRVLKHN